MALLHCGRGRRSARLLRTHFWSVDLTEGSACWLNHHDTRMTSRRRRHHLVLKSGFAYSD